MRLYLRFILAVFLVTSFARADTFCVSTAAELQAALTTAASNGQGDVVQVVQGLYEGNFIYAGPETPDVGIEGGYTPACLSQVVDPINTVLDGLGVGSALVLSTNQAGGFAVDGLTLQNGSFGTGGGLFAQTEGGDLTLANSTVSSNSGGVSVRGANETTFTGNTIINNGPSGGGFLTGTNTVILTNNTITGNTGGLNGGGVRLWGNVITLMDNAISDNSASVGGGVWVQQDGSIVTLINNTITGNTASRGGGGVFLNGGVVTIINSVISNNVTDRANGGGVQVDADMVRLINNTITGNAATDGISGGVRIDLSADTDRADLYNNIIWGNSSGPGINDLTILNDGNLNFIPSPVNLFHNDFDHSAAGTFIQLPFPIDPSNLDNVDPLFVNAPGGDFHLQAASPVINMGDNNAPSLPATDKDGAPRIIGGVVDLGAFEFLNPALFPDLVVTSLGGSTSGLIGGQVAASAALENTGGDVASGAFRLGFYWSTDAVITTGDVFSGSFCDFVDLAAGGIDNCDLLVAVPDTLPPGPHFFGAIVDDLGEITESLETNNSRVADTGVVNLVDTCVLALDLGHATGTLTLGFELGTLDPAIWDVWLISIFGFNNLWSARIPVIDPIVSFPVAFPFPSIGNIGIVTTLTTAENGLACADFKIVDTGGLGASPEELEDLVEQSGVLQDAMRR